MTDISDQQLDGLIRIARDNAEGDPAITEMLAVCLELRRRRAETCECLSAAHDRLAQYVVRQPEYEHILFDGPVDHAIWILEARKQRLYRAIEWEP